MKKTHRNPPKYEGISPLLIALDVAQGLEELAWREVQESFGGGVHLQRQQPSAIRFWYQGDLRRLWALSLAQAAYLVQAFDVPRPKALLGDQHFRALLAQIGRVRAAAPNEYKTLFLAAAGSDSSVMQRLRQALVDATGLVESVEQGDLVIRLVRSEAQDRGWEAFVRISPRPLATRAWRVCNFEGALNATIARAMAVLTQPVTHDCFVNLACGSGTLLIERLGWGRARQAVGIDDNDHALACAAANITAAGYMSQIDLLHADARRLPLADSCADALCADLPFGQLVGSHEVNRLLYPQLLEEAARIARGNARFVVITHEIRLMESLLDSVVWQTEQVIRTTQRGLHPRIYVLRRR